MSTAGFVNPTLADGSTLTVGQPYTSRIGIIQDDANGFTNDVAVVVSAGLATREPDAAQAIGDTSSGAASAADWMVTPTAAGTLTVEVQISGEDLFVDPAAGAGARTYTVAAAPRIAQRHGLGLGLGLGL
jgi:hypothetical protein